jgi:hypothetical protein
VPAGPAPGLYALEIGWYDLVTEERLSLETGETSLEVGRVEVIE